MYTINPIENEQKILGSLLISNRIRKQTLVKGNQFTLPNHVMLFKAIMKADSLDKEPSTPVLESIIGEYYKTGLPPEYTSLIAVPMYDLQNYQGYEDVFLENFKKRESARISKNLIDNLDDDDILTQTINDLNKLNTENQSFGYDAEKECEIFLERLHSEKDETYVPTGIYDFDRYVNGLRNSELMLVAARPAMGKSAFGINVAVNIASNKNAHVLFFTVEMSTQSVMNRVISILSVVETTKIKLANVNKEEDKKIINSLNVFKDLNLEIYAGKKFTVSEVDAKIQTARDKYPNKKIIAIVDYLQKMKPSNYKLPRNEQVSEISSDLKELTIKYDMPVLALAQLSRNSISREGQKPLISDLGESGHLEQDANIIAFLHREDYYTGVKQNASDTEIIIGKNRDGEIGTARAKFYLDLQYFK